MRVTVETKRIGPGLEALKKRLELLRLRKAFVKSGVLGKKPRTGTGPSNAELASIHEFGLGSAPARPFIGPAFLMHKAEYRDLIRRGYAGAVKSNDPNAFRRVLALIGQKMSADIKNFVTAGAPVPPPLSPKTVARKGSSRTLVDTGQLIRSVDYEVVG